MKKFAAVALATVFSSAPAFAQTAVGVGTGISASRSQSNSQATAIGGGNATARGGTGVGVGTGGNPTASITIQGQPASTTSTINNTGTSTVKNVPSVFSPGLAAAGIETCLGSVSGGGSFVGTGFSFGTTIPDPGCGARLDARTLWSMGLKKAAVARLCLNPDIYASMPEVCASYQPARAVAPVAYPARAVAPDYYLSEGATYKGGYIMLTDGKTGQERLCKNYDAPKQHCRAWDGDATHVVVHHTKKKVMVASTPAVPSPAEPEKKAEGKAQ